MRGHSHQDISPWVQRHAGRIAPAAQVLDLACGNGRHARYLADLGHPVTAIDIDLAGIEDLNADERFELISSDLERSLWPFTGRQFGGIVVTNYRCKGLYPHLVDALDDGGILIYDTFAMGNERFGRPRRPEFLLEPAELLQAFAADLHIIAYEHGRSDENGPAMRQRLCATRVH